VKEAGFTRASANAAGVQSDSFSFGECQARPYQHLNSEQSDMKAKTRPLAL